MLVLYLSGKIQPTDISILPLKQNLEKDFVRKSCLSQPLEPENERVLDKTSLTTFFAAVFVFALVELFSK